MTTEEARLVVTGHINWCIQSRSVSDVVVKALRTVLATPGADNPLEMPNHTKETMTKLLKQRESIREEMKKIFESDDPLDAKTILLERQIQSRNQIEKEMAELQEKYS